jgi:hypothetical protein
MRQRICCAHFRETAAVGEILLLLLRGFHAYPGIGGFPLLITTSLGEE